MGVLQNFRRLTKAIDCNESSFLLKYLDLSLFGKSGYRD